MGSTSSALVDVRGTRANAILDRDSLACPYCCCKQGTEVTAFASATSFNESAKIKMTVVSVFESLAVDGN